MEILHGGYALKICEGAFPLSTDSMLLTWFTALPRQAKVLDLGSGCGTLGLLLCGKDPHCHVTGVELTENAHLTAMENIKDNGLSPRLESICADVRNISQIFAPGSFSCCISNPPYFCGGPKSQTVPNARRDDLCSMDELFQAAAWALKYGGDFFIVHRPERLAELFASAKNVGLEPKKLCLVRHDPDSPVILTLVQCRKGAKPGLIWQEICLFDRAGQPTEAYRAAYHL